MRPSGIGFRKTEFYAAAHIDYPLDYPPVFLISFSLYCRISLLCHKHTILKTGKEKELTVFSFGNPQKREETS